MISYIFSATTAFKLNVTAQYGPLQIPSSFQRSHLTVENSRLLSRIIHSVHQSFCFRQLKYSTMLAQSTSVMSPFCMATFLSRPRSGTCSDWNAKQSPKHSLLASGMTIVSFLSVIDGVVAVWDSDTQLVLYADSVAVTTFGLL